MNTPSFKEDHISQIPALQLMQTEDKRHRFTVKAEKLREPKKGMIQVLLTGKND